MDELTFDHAIVSYRRHPSRIHKFNACRALGFKKCMGNVQSRCACITHLRQPRGLMLIIIKRIISKKITKSMFFVCVIRIALINTLRILVACCGTTFSKQCTIKSHQHCAGCSTRVK